MTLVAQDMNSTVLVAQRSAFAATRAPKLPTADGGPRPGSTVSTVQNAVSATDNQAQQDIEDEATVMVRRAASAPVMRHAAQAAPGASAAQLIGLTALPGPLHGSQLAAAASKVGAM